MKRIVEHMELIKAPDGFTERVMNWVLAHPRHSTISYQPLIKPYVWGLILLIGAAMVYMGTLPSDAAGDSEGYFGLMIDLQPVYDWIGNSLASFRLFNDSSIILYLCIGILFSLFLVDELILKRIYRQD